MLCADLCFFELFFIEKKKFEKNSVQAIYLPSSNRRNCHFFPFLIFGYLIWLSFWVFWTGLDLDICFDVLGFSITVCRFQILMLFVLLWICLFHLGKGWFSLCDEEHLRVNGGILGKLDTVDVADVICIVFLFQQIIRH